MSEQTDKIRYEIRNYSDSRVGDLSQHDYLDVLGKLVRILDGYLDCTKDEMEEDEESWDEMEEDEES